MEIDWKTAIIGLIMVLLCIVPLVIMHLNKIKKEQKILNILKSKAQQNNCIISQYEFCGDNLLGIDENKKIVFFYKQKDEESILKLVDLSEIQTCQILKKIRNTKNNKETLSIIERIELSFTPIVVSHGETKFELFDNEINMLLGKELQFVEKWTKQINELLRNK